MRVLPPSLPGPRQLETAIVLRYGPAPFPALQARRLVALALASAGPPAYSRSQARVEALLRSLPRFAGFVPAQGEGSPQWLRALLAPDPLLQECEAEGARPAWRLNLGLLGEASAPAVPAPTDAATPILPS